jgi:hypothetical protein
MKSIAGGVALGPNPAIEVLDGSSGVEELVEDRDDSAWMALWADTRVVGTNGRERHLEAVY